MIEPTDEDIREAKRLTRPDWVVYKDSYSGLTYRELAQLCGLHARTLAKLRLAVEALRACRRATLHNAPEPRSNVRDIVDEALTQIKDEKP